MSARRPRFAHARTMLVCAAMLVVGLTGSAGALAAKGAPPATARDLAQAYFSNTLTRAEVVSVVGRVVHDFRIDEGRVTAVRPGAIDLLERDGTRQTIAVGRQTQFFGGRVGGLPFALRGTRVVTLRDNDGPAHAGPPVRHRATARQEPARCRARPGGSRDLRGQGRCETSGSTRARSSPSVPGRSRSSNATAPVR